MLTRVSRSRQGRRLRRKTTFPQGFSATEPLVPPSADGSTPITDALPRSILLDPTAYKPTLNHRDKPPSKNPTVSLSPLEKQILVNPFAKILASKPRADRTAQSALPRDLLIRFGVFANPETQDRWLLPDDSTGRGSNTSGYRLIRKTAVDELGGRVRNKKWGVVAPMLMNEKAKKNLVWRDGMGEHILGLYREEAWKRLDGLTRNFLYEVQLDDKLKTARVGQRIPGRRKKEASSPTQGSQRVESNEHNVKDGKESSTTKSDGKSHKGNEALHISAVLYLGPDALRNATWEIRPITVSNQSTSATIFNMRRLFPTMAEKYMNRLLESTTTIAVQSSEISCTTLYHMLRLAFYLEGDITVNMTKEEKDKYEMEVGFGKFRAPRDQDEHNLRAIFT